MITLETLRQRPLSYSSLKEFAKSPAHYIAYLNKEKKTTPAMLFGSMIHCLLLQPTEFNKQFAVTPNLDRRTKDGKEKYEAFVLASEGKEVVSEEQYSDAVRLVEKAMSMPHIAEAVNGCHLFEQEWKHELNDLPFRGFFDGMSDDYILEVKTTSDASPKTIIRDFYDRSYHIQSGLYFLASNKPTKYLIIETSSPHSIMLANATEDYTKKGIEDAFNIVNQFQSCMDNNLWDMSYDYFFGGDFSIDLPNWVK